MTKDARRTTPDESLDPLFGVRTVSAYDPGNGGYASAAWTGTGTFIPYNGTSGNWRLDQVAIRGVQSVPEPTSVAELGIGVLGLLKRRKRRA